MICHELNNNAVSLSVLVATLIICATTSIQAQAVIDNGTVAVGINPAGNLITADAGLLFIPTGGDGLIGGCACEGWGVGDLTTGSFGMAGEDFGFYGIASSGMTVSGTGTLGISTGSAAVSETNVVDNELDLAVTHSFSPSSTDLLYRIDVGILNQGAGATDNLVYRRAMDWDIPPTEFLEFTTIQGWPATALIASSNDGFASGNINYPLGVIDGAGAVLNENFTDAGPADHGAAFDFSFGTLAAGDTQEFSIFFGAAESEADALLALANVGAEVYSLGQPSGPDGATLGIPNTFIFGFAGVGGTPIGPGGATTPINQFSDVASAFIDMRQNQADVAMSRFGEPSHGRKLWNLHVAGHAGTGSYDATTNNVALDYTFAGISVSADTVRDGAVAGFAHALFGGSLGVGRTSADLGSDGETGTLSGNSADMMLYGRLWGGQPVFAEGVLNVARHNFDQDRIGMLNTYSSDPKATSIGALVRAGWTRALSDTQALSFYGELASTHTRVSGFDEDNGGVSTEGFSQTRSRAGLGLRVENQHVSENQTTYARLDVAALARIGGGDYDAGQTTVGGAAMTALADGPDDTLLRIRGTLGMIQADRMNVSVDLSSVIGSEGFRDHRLAAQLKFEF